MKLAIGSLCSGIGSEALAWYSLGWQPIWFAEIDLFCSALLEDRYAAPNLGDITKIQSPPAPDLIVGGTPCQSFSINSRGDGLDDPRGQLSMVFMDIVARLRPRWVIWENVQNALRIDGGRAFGSIVGALAECGYGWSYRILDLQCFGVPQRRRRLFLVGFRGGCGPAVASLFDSVPGQENSRSTPQAWQGDMVGTDGGPTKESRVDGWSGDETPKRGIDCMPTFRTSQGGEGTGVICARGIRNLTIEEYERLQGFPVGYTTIKYKGKLASDAMRRKALGNSFPPPILYWIGRRIDWMESKSNLLCGK